MPMVSSIVLGKQWVNCQRKNWCSSGGILAIPL